MKFRPAVYPLCYLFQNHWTKINQIWCVSYSHKWGVQRQFFCPTPWGPLGGVKRSNIIYFQFQSQFQRFYTKLCACTYKLKIQNISDGIFILSLGSCPMGGTWGFLWAKTGLSPPVKYFTDRSKAVLLLWFFYVFVLSCVCYVFVRVC